MLHRGISFLCLCTVAVQLLQVAVSLPPINDPEYRALLEDKVVSSVSLKEIEEMVENDESVRNAPKSKIIIIPKRKNPGKLFGEDERDAIIIHRKTKKPQKQVEKLEYRIDNIDVGSSNPKFDFESNFRQFEGVPFINVPDLKSAGSSYAKKLSNFDRSDSKVDFESNFRQFEGIPFVGIPDLKSAGSSHAKKFSDFERSNPKFDFESNFRQFDEGIPSFFSMSDLESAGSSNAEKFYESLVDSVMRKSNFGKRQDPFEILDLAGSEDVPRYQPRFDYDAYSKDSTEVKLQGKPYWKDAQERKDEVVDENGCRTVIKKMVDPEDEKKSGGEKAKSVVITKECEYPTLSGPDAKITEASPLRLDTSRFDRDSSSGYDEQPLSYEKTRPEELNFKSTEDRDPLAPDYIDTMLDKHFKTFPGFSNPLSSFKGYQERFKLRIPEAFKDVKPSVGVQTYEYTHPKSGFDEERQSSTSKDSVNSDAPKTYEHHYHYDYPPQNSRKPDYDDSQEVKPTAKSSNGKDPKMMKKSFAYYRKDNPKDDPNDHQYAEEYAQGNYRSFSSSYDSEKDGPKKQ